MDRIKVVEVVSDVEGGGTDIALAITTQLDPARFEVTLVAPRASALADRCQESGVTYQPLSLKASRTSRATSQHLRATFSQMRPDVVHAHGTRAGWYVSWSMPCRSAEVGKLVYSEHLFSFDARRGLAKLPWYAIEGYLCHRADLITTGCRANAQRAVAWHWASRDRIGLDHYGIDLESLRKQTLARVPRAQLGVPEDAYLVGTLGRLIPQKGFKYLIDAALQVLRVIPQTHFLVVGDGELRALLEDRCQALGIDRYFHFLGRQHQPWRMLAGCDAIALPSLYEGLWLVALEALAQGHPLVATSVGGAPEFVVPGHTGLLVPPRDSAALAQAIIQLLHDPERRASMRQQGPEAARKYDLRDTVATFAAMYVELSEKRMQRR